MEPAAGSFEAVVAAFSQQVAELREATLLRVDGEWLVSRLACLLLLLLLCSAAQAHRSCPAPQFLPDTTRALFAADVEAIEATVCALEHRLRDIKAYVAREASAIPQVGAGTCLVGGARAGINRAGRGGCSSAGCLPRQLMGAARWSPNTPHTLHPSIRRRLRRWWRPASCSRRTWRTSPATCLPTFPRCARQRWRRRAAAGSRRMRAVAATRAAAKAARAAPRSSARPRHAGVGPGLALFRVWGAPLVAKGGPASTRLSITRTHLGSLHTHIPVPPQQSPLSLWQVHHCGRAGLGVLLHARPPHRRQVQRGAG